MVKGIRAKISSGDAKYASDLTRELLVAFNGEFRPRRPPVVRLLTLREVVAYFADKHPGEPQVLAGALLANPHPKGFLIFQVFLDHADNLCVDGNGTPYGRRMVAQQLDDELAALLGQRDLLVVRWSPGNKTEVREDGH
jgi:hypothetical protein